MLHELPGKRPSTLGWKMFFSEKKSSRVVCPVCVDLCSASHLADAFRSCCHVSFSPFLSPLLFFSFFSFPFFYFSLSSKITVVKLVLWSGLAE
jgi:hypothetical protein